MGRSSCSLEALSLKMDKIGTSHMRSSNIGTHCDFYAWISNSQPKISEKCILTILTMMVWPWWPTIVDRVLSWYMTMADHAEKSCVCCKNISLFFSILFSGVEKTESVDCLRYDKAGKWNEICTFFYHFCAKILENFPRNI